LLCRERTRSEVSFFCEKNSSELASSKGWMSFFLVKRSTKGRFSVAMSATASFRI
jgi:hypothetical protein